MAHTAVLSEDQYFQLYSDMPSIQTADCIYARNVSCYGCKVTSITVEKNEAGLTNYEYKRESVKFFVTPAGYVGSGVIGACLIIAAATRLGALIASGILAVVLLVTIFFQKNWIPRVLTISVILVVAGLFVLHFVGPDEDALGVRLVTLFIGVMNALYSVWDIYDDTVKRDEKGSDANECATIIGCPDASKAVGACWMTLSFVLMVGAVAAHLILLEPLHE